MSRLNWLTWLIIFLYFSYETSDGIARQEQAELRNIGTENEAIAVSGTVSWVDKDGQSYTLNYVADENGFRPEGAHLPRVWISSLYPIKKIWKDIKFVWSYLICVSLTFPKSGAICIKF